VTKTWERLCLLTVVNAHLLAPGNTEKRLTKPLNLFSSSLPRNLVFKIKSLILLQTCNIIANQVLSRPPHAITIMVTMTCVMIGTLTFVDHCLLLILFFHSQCCLIMLKLFLLMCLITIKYSNVRSFKCRQLQDYMFKHSYARMFFFDGLELQGHHFTIDRLYSIFMKYL